MDQAPSIDESQPKSPVDTGTAPPFEGNLVRWRLAHGSLCHLCPLNGQRKVGCDGPQDADHILIGEAPGHDEETYRSGVDEFGLPFQGKSGWAMKNFLLAPAGLVDVAQVRGAKWARIRQLNAFILNVIMCRPPKNKITSPNGRKAVAACHESAIAVVKELFRIDPHRAIETLGGTALEMIQPATKGKVGVHRGRPRQIRIDLLEPMPWEKRIRILLRGKKPPGEWTGKPRKEWVAEEIPGDPYGHMAEIGWRNHIGWILKAIEKGPAIEAKLKEKAAKDAAKAEAKLQRELAKALKQSLKKPRTKKEKIHEPPSATS